MDDNTHGSSSKIIGRANIMADGFLMIQIILTIKQSKNSKRHGQLQGQSTAKRMD